MDAVALARFQFAFTVAYHFFFVPLSIGLGLIMVLFERRYYKSQSAEDKAMADLWVKIFAATFAIGVATGITMEFAFGTNWATYSRFVGDIFGAPLAAEGLFAFFLESTFLGVLIFGREPSLGQVLLRVGVARVAGLAALGAVDHHRELVDADAGRLRDRRRRRSAARPSSPTSSRPGSTRRRCRAIATSSTRCSSQAAAWLPRSARTTCSRASTRSSAAQASRPASRSPRSSRCSCS